MGDFPANYNTWQPCAMIGSYSDEGLFLLQGNAPSLSLTWPAAKAVIYVPFVLARRALVTKMGWYNGATLVGNFDVGIYDNEGNRLVNSGSQAQAGASVLQVVDTTDTWIGPGRFFLALTNDGNTATLGGWGAGSINQLIALGLYTETTGAFGLPATATFATATSTTVPIVFALVTRTAI